MQVYLCTFEIHLTTVKLSPETKLLEIEAVLRSEKGEIIIVGAMKPLPKRGIAMFNEAFEIRTDLLLDPQTQLYHSNIIVLEIRRANQPLNMKISSSICRFNLAEVLNLGPIPSKSFPAVDESFTAVVSIKCINKEDTGKRRPLRKKSEKKLSSNDSVIQKKSLNQEISRDRRNSIDRKSRSSSKEAQEKNKGKTSSESAQLSSLKSELEKEQLEHILTQQRLHKAELSLAEQENLVNHLSALVNQRQTDVVELTARITSIQEEISSLEEAANFINEKKEMEKERGSLKLRIQELQKSLQASASSYSALLKSQNKLERNLEQEQKKTVNLTKTLENTRKDMLRVKMQNQSLLSSLRKVETEKESLKESIRLWKQQMSINVDNKDKEYDILSQQFLKLHQRLIDSSEKNGLGMVNRRQLEQLQQFYKAKIAEYEERQGELKKQIDIIEKEMINMEDLLEQKEENEQILIQHAQKLQNDLDVVNSESNWWIKIISNQLDGPNGTVRSTTQSDLRSRNAHLLKILQESSHLILESEKNKREIVRLEKCQGDLQRNMLELKEQTREVKEKLSTMLKENKKLLEKNGKSNKEIENLKRTIRKLTHEISSAKAHQNQVRQRNQSLTIERSILQQENTKMKSEIEQDQKLMKEMSADTQSRTVWKNHKEIEQIPMPVIKQTNQQMLISIPLESIQGSEKEQDKENPQSVTAREISTLLDKRGAMLEELFTQISKASEEKQQSGESLRRELKNVNDLSVRFKLALIRAGQKNTVKEWQLSMRRLSEEVDRLFLTY